MHSSSLYGATATYSYDSLNRLTSVTYDDGTSIEYTYDAAGNRTGMRVTTVGCLRATDATPCPDGDLCNGDEFCQDGTCMPGTVLVCDDGNLCTDDSCDPATGCVHTNNSAPCDDGNACTVGDVCGGGACTSGIARDCSDGNPCTADTCDPATGCQNDNLANGTPCPDGDLCNGDETCQNGMCTNSTPLSCDDGNLCTDDSCDPATGCVHTDNSQPCDDGNLCTVNDTCSGGHCSGGTPLSCDDGNACTDDWCEPLTGCAHANNTDSCDDGEVCTFLDQCNEGLCIGQFAASCGSLGDVDCDGQVGTTDALVALCLFVGLCDGTQLPGPCNDGTYRLSVADWDRNGQIDPSDALTTLAIFVNLVSPCDTVLGGCCCQ